MESQNVEHRLRNLEQRFRCMVIAWAVSLIATLILGTLVGRAVSQPQAVEAAIIRAHTLEIDDDMGHARIILAVERSVGPTIRLGTPLVGANLINPTKPNIFLGVTTSDMLPAQIVVASGIGLADHESRVSIGAGPDHATLGVSRATPQGSATASLSAYRYRAPGLDLPFVSLDINDAQGFAATLGQVRLGTPSTGTTETRSAASLMLIDPQGKVLWSAP